MFVDAAMPPRRTRASKESAKKAVSEADTGVEVKDVEKETEIGIRPPVHAISQA